MNTLSAYQLSGTNVNCELVGVVFLIAADYWL